MNPKTKVRKCCNSLYLSQSIQYDSNPLFLQISLTLASDRLFPTFLFPSFFFQFIFPKTNNLTNIMLCLTRCAEMRQPAGFEHLSQSSPLHFFSQLLLPSLVMCTNECNMGNACEERLLRKSARLCPFHRMPVTLLPLSQPFSLCL